MDTDVKTCTIPIDDLFYSFPVDGKTQTVIIGKFVFVSACV